MAGRLADWVACASNVVQRCLGSNELALWCSLKGIVRGFGFCEHVPSCYEEVLDFAGYCSYLRTILSWIVVVALSTLMREQQCPLACGNITVTIDLQNLAYTASRL